MGRKIKASTLTYEEPNDDDMIIDDDEENKDKEEDDKPNEEDMPSLIATKRKLIPFSERSTQAKESRLESLLLTQTVNTSTFFTDAIVHEYNQRVGQKLGDQLIVSFDGLQTMMPTNSLNECQIAVKQAIIASDLCSKYEEEKASERVCEKKLKSGVCRKYIEMAIDRSTQYQPNDNYDIAFLLSSTSFSNASELTKVLNGFIIVQRDECSKFPNAYALNLVCSREGSGGGNLLLGLYLFSIASHPLKTDGSLILERIVKQSQPYGAPILHVGLLELSGSFTNIVGYCLYRKFGFVEKSELGGRNSYCFMGKNNLPMIRQFDQDDATEKERICRIVLGDKSAEYEKPKLCYSKDAKVQETLALLYKMKYFRLIDAQDAPSKDDRAGFLKRVQFIQEEIDKLEKEPLDTAFEKTDEEGDQYIVGLNKKMLAAVKHLLTTRGGNKRSNKRSAVKRSTKKRRRTNKKRSNKRKTNKRRTK